MLLLDKNLDRLRWVDQIHQGRIVTLAQQPRRGRRVRSPTPTSSSARCSCPAGRAPIVVTEDMVRTMKPGAVIVDVAVDQGGCIETTHETTHADPVYEVPRRPALRRRQHAGRGAVHVDLRAHERDAAVRADARGPRRRRRDARPIRRCALGVNTVAGRVTHPIVAEALDHVATPLGEALAA